LYNKGGSLVALGEHEKAKKSYEKSIEIEPTDPDVYLNLYELCIVSGYEFKEEYRSKMNELAKGKLEEEIRLIMLEILEIAKTGNDVDSQLESWKEEFADVKLDWSFTEIDNWLSTGEFEDGIKENIQKAVDVFKEHQKKFEDKK